MVRKKFLSLFACLFVLMAFTSLNAKAQDILVPDDYPTIQAAIDAAYDSGGGTVNVAAGTYSAATNGESFPLIMKDGVQLIGAGSDVCILDAQGLAPVVIHCTGAGNTARIEGFKIMNASSSDPFYGGGIYLDNSSLIVVNNIITGNVARNGGGIVCYYSSAPVIANNLIVINNALVGGGIICYPNSFPIICNNVIFGNYAFYGGAVYCNTDSAPTIVNNTIIGNSARYGAGIYCYTNSSAAVIKNNIIAWNSAVYYGGGVYCRPLVVPSIDFNNIYNNTPENYYGFTPGPETKDISVDPEFVSFVPGSLDYTAFDLHLQTCSWCIDAGTNEFREIVDFDFDGHERPLDGDGDKEPVVDIGADEVVPPPVALAGDDQTVSADDNGEATVTLNGAGSFDPGGETLNYEWKDSSDDVIGDTAEVTVTLGLGTHTFTLMVSNINGTGTDEVKITVEDTTPPVPDEVTLPTVEGECSAEVTAAPTASDNCAGTVEGTTSDTLPIVFTEQGTHTVTWTYDDGNGNTATQEQTVIVRDVTAPVPDAPTLPTVEGECSAKVETAPTATDNCLGQITATTNDPVSYTAQGTHTIKWIYNDGNGNITEQEQTVIVRDVTAPVPDAEILPPVEGECSVEVTTAPTATDNCAGTVMGTTSGALPVVFTEEGSHTLTWTYDDGNGNSATQEQTVIVRDVTAPVPDVANLPALEGECLVEITTAPTATDNCAGTITGTTTGPLPLAFTENGTHTVTWTYDDGNGNTATQTQTVKVEDITPPTILLSESTCVNFSRWMVVNMLTVSASDNCSSEVELTIDKVEIFNKRGHRVWGSGVYRVVGNDIYVIPNGKDWSICVKATAIDGSGNTRTDRLCQSLTKCNRWSEHMARLIWMLFHFMMRHCHCW